MENVLKMAFARQKKEPNLRLQSMIDQVEGRYFPAELEDQQLAQVWAAGNPNRSPKKEKPNE